MRTLARLLLVLLVVKALAEPLPGGPPGLGGALVPRRSVASPSSSSPDSEASASFSTENLIVVATVDGHLHAVDAKSGATKWTLKDEWGPLASVQENPSLLSDQDFADPSTQPSEPDSDFVPPHISQDGIIIPEPVGNGDLYYYAPGEDIKKLPFSIKDIAAHPSFVTDANIAYSTKKVSRLLAIHPATGALLHSYGVDEDPFAASNAWDSTIVNPILIARTEYMLVISDLNAKKVKWNITFGEFTPASIPDTLFDLGQDPSPKDVIIGKKLKNEKENLLSMSANVDGSVILDDLKNENAWELNFNSPALAAFSVGSANAQGHQVAKIYPAANSNPDPLPSSPFKSPRKAENNVYVGIVKDSYYLLSHANTNLRGIASSSDKQVVGRIEPAAKSTTTQHPPTSIKKPAITPLPSSASSQQSDDTSTECIPKQSSPENTCLVGIHALQPPPKSPRKNPTTPNLPLPPLLLTGTPIPAPTIEEWNAFFHVTSGWRLFEQVLGFTDATERVFVYIMTFLTVCCLTGVGYFLGSGGGVRVGGVVVKGAGEIEKRYRGIVRRLGSRGDFVAGAVKFCEDVTGDVCGEGEEGKERLLPEFVDSNGAGVVSAVPLSVVMSRLEKEEEELPALPVENGGGSSSGGVGGFLGSFFKTSGSSTETKKEDTEKFNEYDVLDEILRKAKELPALPIEDSDKEKKKGKGKGKGLGGPKSTPKKVVKKPAAKQLPQVKNPKETSVEILSDSVSNEEEEEELELDNMDRLLSAPDLIAPSERAESENQTIVHTGDTEFSVVSNKSSVSNLKEEQSLRTMTVSDQILGHGSHGTMVFKGTFEGRPVAIKRLLLDFYDVAHHEVKILRDSDQHQNVIRYFYQEATEKFMYIALELCPASLADVVENTTNPDLHQIRLSLKPRNVLSQIISGIQYLHSLKLVHRDIKPQNILIGESRGKLNSHPRILITDFGLCKRLADDQSSFHNTMHTTGGTIGWRAPECMINQAGAKPGSQEDTSESDHSQWVLLAPSQQMRITKSIDVFSAGCVYYYYLTGGVHPFGDKYTREINILRGNHRLDRLDGILDGGVEAKDLIRRMIFKDPKKRPDTETILAHPYFWTPSQKLSFLQEVSDRLETEERDPPSAILKQLERGAEKAVGKNWSSKLDRRILEDLRNFRQYDTKTVQDLLRVIRNKKNHYQELSAELKGVMGVVPDGFLGYFVSRFPGLLMHVYYVVEGSKGMKKEPLFLPYFGGRE